MTRHLFRTAINGNVNIGLFGYANDHAAFFGNEVPDHIIKEAHEVLKVPVHRIDLCGTGLVGVFMTGNNKGLIIPAITFDSEHAKLKKCGIPFHVIHTKLTALGNNVIANDEHALVNPEFTDKEIKEIEKALGVTAKRATIAELETVGALTLLHKKTAIIHDEAESSEVKLVEKTFNVSATRATLNRGSPYLRSAIVLNSNGFVVGSLSTGVELQNIDRAFGYIQ